MAELGNKNNKPLKKELFQDILGPKDIKVWFGGWGPILYYKSTCPQQSKTKLESNHELIGQETNYSWK